ncbi:MAG: vegetative protein [bacterium]
MKKQSECKIEGCGRPVRAKGYCDRHYKKWKKGAYGKTRYKPCREEDCTARRYQKAYCKDHYYSVFLKKPAEGAES